ncbi:MAG TPA: YicC/YloC family endoribonuclease [Rhizomicrobium sp.]|jgi:uncharacterized protein (TIGR00255 family)|nr:YicC/YloC family endoribonuclease [Rhizomicrobium sp.]
MKSLASMTGFAESVGSHAGLRWRWEAKSVNGRSLDMRLRLPPSFETLETPARRLAAERFQRGSFQIALTVEQQEAARGLKIDSAVLASAIKLAREIEAETGLPAARVDGLLALKGVIVQDDIAATDQVARGHRDAAMLESLMLAFDLLARERCAEGGKLSAVLMAQMDEVARLVGQAGRLAEGQGPALKERLLAQVKELLGTGPVAEDRLAQEAALLAVRADVREELDRLAAHVQDARELLTSGRGIGRKLDFLAQEFNREANTLCSKSSDIALTRVGLALKAMIDQFREQAQNVE